MGRGLLLTALLSAFAPAAGQAAVAVSEVLQIRRSYLAHWEALSEDGTSGLERFASTVQLVVDTRAGMQWGSRDEAVRAVLDDLADLFVGASYQLEKSLVMLSPPVLGNDAIVEEDSDLSGFAPGFQAGEGRFRHFALNAAASYAVPEALVELAARLRGRDLQGGSAENAADRAADIATNRIGREFTRLLRQRPLGELGDGSTVRYWIIEQFGER